MSVPVSFRVTTQQYDDLRKLCLLAGMPISRAARIALTHGIAAMRANLESSDSTLAIERVFRDPLYVGIERATQTRGDTP